LALSSLFFSPLRAQTTPKYVVDLEGTVATKPATCTVGQRYFATDATPGSNLYLCTATNTWTLLAGTNILPLANTFTNTNQFNSLLTANGGINLPPVGAALGDVALQAFDNDVLWVSPSGSDSNNGRGRGSAMLTWYHAACSLPGGNCASQIAGNGTIYMFQGSAWNATATCGAWIMGSQDPNFASPPACWLKQSNGGYGIITTIGVPSEAYGPNGPMAVAGITGGGDNHSQPGIWLSNTGAETFKNIAVGIIGTPLMRGVVVGECSDGTRGNACNAAGDVFYNVNAVDHLGEAGAGPSIDITGGSFWIKLLHVRAQGNDVANAATSNAAAAILLDGTGNNGIGLTQLYDINTAQGGVKVIPGTNYADVHIVDLTTEGQNAEPAVEFASGGGGPIRGELSGIQVADNVGIVPAVENDADFGQSLHVEYTYCASAPCLVGPMQIGGEVGGGSTSVQSQSFLSEGQTGFANGWVIGKRDDVQKAGALYPVRFTNAAVSSACSGWTLLNLTLTCGQADNYGGTSAGVSSGEGAGASIRFTSGSNGVEGVTLSLNEVIRGGFWSRSTTANGYAGNAYTPGFVAVQGTGFALSGGCSGDSVMGDGQSTWNTCTYTVTSVGTPGTSYISFGANADSTHHVAVWAPVLNFIPAGTLTNDELAEDTNSLRPYDTSCVVGNYCGLSSSPIQAPGGFTGTSIVDSGLLTLTNGPLNFFQSGGACSFGTPPGINWQVCVNGTDLQWEHPGAGGSGRFHVDADLMVGPPGSATSSANFNSFAWDNEGSYWDGTQAQNNLWEHTVSTTPASGSAINSRENMWPIFTGSCSSCTADFALGSSGTNPSQGNLSGPPMFDWIVLPRDGFTATFSHTFTANHAFSYPDVDGTFPVISGTPVTGHCTAWVSPLTIGDAGVACGGSGTSPFSLAAAGGTGTVGNGTLGSFVWTFSLSSGTNPTATFANNSLTFNVPITAPGFISTGNPYTQYTCTSWSGTASFLNFGADGSCNPSFTIGTGALLNIPGIAGNLGGTSASPTVIGFGLTQTASLGNQVEVANLGANNATGTGTNLAAKLTTTGWQTATTSDTAIPLLACQNESGFTCGTTGSPALAVGGTGQVIMDASASSTAGEFLIASTTTGGEFHATASPGSAYVQGILLDNSTVSGAAANFKVVSYQPGTASGSTVSSVSNSDSSLTISPTTGAVVASLALGHANTFTATQGAPVFNAATGFQIGGTATNGNCLVGNGTDYVSGSCAGTTPTNNWFQMGNGRQSVGFTANATTAGLFVLDTATKFSNIEYDVNTLDATGTDFYDIAIYSCPSLDCSATGVTATLVADLGTGTQGITLTTTGAKTTAVHQTTPITLQPGVYVIAITGNAATAKLNSGDSCLVSWSTTSVGTTTSGQALGSFTTPASVGPTTTNVCNLQLALH